LAGNDTVDSSGLPAGLVQLQVSWPVDRPGGCPRRPARLPAPSL